VNGLLEEMRIVENLSPNVDDIFLAALERASAEERFAYLEAACAGNPGLRRRVERLLEAQAKGGSFLEAPAPEIRPTIDQPSTEAPGTVIGPYKLIEQIGEGGMGTVWMAQQTEPVKRLVAVKLIKAGMDSKQVIARFEAERQALALMDHPNIAKVLDAGTTSAGRPYFVMDLVKGVPITRYCDEHHLTPRQRLELFLPVCQAVQHAHQKGIIHRDLKPSNVLVALYDGKPVPKVIDFGVAKAAGQPLTDKTLITGFGNIVGTLEYMSPEQAEINQLDIDTRSDIYSLGVLLYELLAGSPPFSRQELEKAGMLEMLRVIREQEPTKPSTKLSTAEGLPTLAANRGTEPAKLTKLVRGELDWIVMKALEKDRNRRYETANSFAMDVQRYLADEPVQACPPSAWYRGRKFARRHRRALGTAVVLAVAMLVTVGAVAWSVGWANRDRAARRARAASDLDLALDRAELFLGQEKRSEALAALDRAELLAGEAPPDPAREERLAVLKERRNADARDQKFIDRFENILLRVQSQVDLENNLFTLDAAFPAIRDALRQYGIEIGVMAPGQAAALVQGRPELTRRNLIAALDECLRWTPRTDSQARQWLLATLEAADNDPWRVDVRKALVGRQWQELGQLARTADDRKHPASFLLLVATALPAQQQSIRLELLRRTQRANPADLWANYRLAAELDRDGQLTEAIRYFTAALALRPDSPGIYLSRGHALERLGEVDAAIADAQQCIALAPEYSMAHTHLGLALWDKGRLDEAIAACREALRIDRDNAAAHVNLGLALSSRRRLDEAIAEYREALRIKKALPADHAKAHYNLGNALREQGNLPGAMTQYRQAIVLNPDYAEAHCNLGLALWRHQGEFREALEELRRGHELGSRGPRWRYPSAQWVRQCERLVELDGQLAGFLERKATPAGPGERLELAELCSLKRLNRAAARFFEEAFVVQPRLADDLDARHRYNAACHAAMAGCGQDRDADQVAEPERARLRRQALDWLRADLAAYAKKLESSKPEDATLVQQQMRHWLVDSDLARVRGSEALARFPEGEREQWQKLWDDVAATLARTEDKSPVKK
jgi:serine/threonine protein kinase/tetratricopeptide (TPR) repeat protein